VGRSSNRKTPGSRHRELLSESIGEVGPTGNLIPDAHLAALAREHGLTVVSTDAYFAKFRDVAWLNPVTGEEPSVSGRSGARNS
jgi:predicted nucleic acid-binding protein